MCMILYIIITCAFSPLPYLYKAKIHIPLKNRICPMPYRENQKIFHSLVGNRLVKGKMRALLYI